MASKGRERSIEKRGKSGAGRTSAPHLPTVSIIGAGRLGLALALALSRNGYRIEAIVARRIQSARRSARRFPEPPLALSSGELERLPQSELLFITTPDDLIKRTAALIASTIRRESGRRVAFHSSGALSSDELSSLREQGFHTGSLHPLVAISDAQAGADALGRAFFCIEGDGRAVRVAGRIVRRLGARSFSIGAKEKALYHAAAVTASGHMVALFDIALEMLARCGLEEREARAVLLPLLESTAFNLSQRDAARALTGTFARADIETVRRHLDAINGAGLKDALAAYTLLGNRSLKLAERAGASEEALKVIASALAEAVED